MTESIDTLRAQLLQLQRSHAAGTLDAPTHAALKAPLERRLVDAVLAQNAAPPPATPAPAQPTAAAGPRLWGVALVGVVGVALAGYWWTGTPGAIGQAPAAFTADAGVPPATSPGAAPVTKEQVEAMLARLVARLKDKPEDVDGWLMLGRSYMALERPSEAVDAYRQALKLRPDDASLLADTADAIASVDGRGLDGEPMQMIEKALRLDPRNLKALALAGSAAFNRSDFAGAARYWDQVVSLGPADSKLVELARGGAAEARQRGALPAAAPGASAPATPGAPTAATAATASVSGTVRLSPALQAQAAPGDTVFVFARAAEGGRMPLAILRRKVSDLPIRFTLDDSLSMSPAARISSAGRVIVGARISKSGQAMPQPGDLEGLSAPVAVGATGVVVDIGSKLP